MVEVYTEILGFTAPSTLSAGATVNVRVQVKNASGVTGHAVCYIDGNPFDPEITYITVGSGVAYLGPGGSAWVDVTLWAAMPAWNFVLTARNYELTSQISRTIALTAATFSAQPLTVEKIGAITYSWTSFQAGYWIYVDTLSGPPEWGEGSYPVLGSIRLGDTSSGSLDTTAPGVAGTYVRQARQEVTGLESNTITLVVTALPTSATVTVRGKCTGGYPLPSMRLETYDKGVEIKAHGFSTGYIGIVYEDSVVVTGAGIHRVQGRMVLTNALGSYEFLTETKEFTLG